MKTTIKVVLDSLYVILMLAAIVLLPGLFVFGIAASFTGDGFTDRETDIGIRLCVTMLGVIFAGRIVEILRGKDSR